MSASDPAGGNDWRTSFEIVKELNSHAGRVATLLGLTFTTTVFSLSFGPIHDSLTNIDADGKPVLYGSLLAVGFMLFSAATGVGTAMVPPVPSDVLNANRWQFLIEQKMRACQRSVVQIISALGALSIAWLVAYTGAWITGKWVIALAVAIYWISGVMLDARIERGIPLAYVGKRQAGTTTGKHRLRSLWPWRKRHSALAQNIDPQN